MISFKEYLTEVFSKLYKWKTLRDGTNDLYIAIATTDNDKELEIGINKEKGGLAIDFSVDDSMHVTGEGDQFRIFATVIDFLAYVLKKEPNINNISFTSSKSSSSRTRLYKSMLKKYLPKWKIQVDSVGSHDEIIAFKK